jgi:DNA polymerase III psi subunit
MNSHQQQLLQLLQIKPLQLHADFQQFQPLNESSPLVLPAILNAEINGANASAGIILSNEIPAEFSALAADIQRALQLYLPDLLWRWSAQLQQCELHSTEIHSTEIHTPDLAALANPALKQQLWQFMSQHAGRYENN